jgi:hypothetical protein
LLACRHREQFIADAKYPESGTAEEQEAFILEKAWEYQTKAVANDWAVADVDLESLKSLEIRMFEVSKEAGQAGYYQWGLDAGDHQDGWFPYANHPAEWNHRDGEYDDDLEVCFFVSMSSVLVIDS